MKALTIHQPYAHWIMERVKYVENRTWATQYRGQLAIHAGLSQGELRRLHCQGKYPVGVVLGTVDLVAVYHVEDLRALAANKGPDAPLPDCAYTVGEVLTHCHTFGPMCWILEDVMRFETPIAAKGQRGLWEWDEVIHAV